VLVEQLRDGAGLAADLACRHLSSLSSRGDHEHPTPSGLHLFAGCRKPTRLACTSRAFDHGDLLALGAADDLGDQVELHRQHVRRTQRPDMLGSIVTVHQRDADGDRPRGQILGELTSYGATADHVAGRNELLDLAANVGRVPRGVLGAEPVDGALGQSVPIQGADRSRVRAGAPRGQAEAELDEFVDPADA
jgi:hypothetical protein